MSQAKRWLLQEIKWVSFCKVNYLLLSDLTRYFPLTQITYIFVRILWPYYWCPSGFCSGSPPVFLYIKSDFFLMAFLSQLHKCLSSSSVFALRLIPACQTPSYCLKSCLFNPNVSVIVSCFWILLFFVTFLIPLPDF